MKRLFLILAFVLLLALSISFLIYTWNSHLTWRDIATFNANPRAIGTLKGEPLERLGLKRADLRRPTPGAMISYLGKSRYLNDARAAVVHTIDDSTQYIIDCLDALDKYGIKATVFVSTEGRVISQLWPRLRRAIANGHEVGSHSRRHQCQWPDTRLFCFRAYTDYEISGSREDILKNTNQPYVWSWCYPCGNCANYEFVQRKLARAGYLIARNYPAEAQGMHNLPNLQSYDSNPYNATYTQVVQKKGGIAKSGRTNVPEINSKFDEVYHQGGIYNFLSHPQWLDYGSDQFYEQHLAHVGRRTDVWYVPMGPLYAYRTVLEKTEVRALEPEGVTDRFAVSNDLDPKVFTNSITLEFSLKKTAQVHIRTSGKPLPEKTQGLTDRWDAEYFRREGERVWVTIHPNTILEFRCSFRNRGIE